MRGWKRYNFVKMFLIIFLFLFSLNFVSSSPFSDCSVYGNCQLISTITSSGGSSNITNNYYNATGNATQFTTAGDTLTLLESWFSTMWNSLFRNWNNQNLNTTSSPTFVNITASWFKGLFNWTSGDNWNIFNGSTLTFNESKLSTIFYNVTSVQVVRGTGAGVLADIQSYNNIPYNVTEASGANGLDFRVNFTGVTDLNQIKIRYKSSSTESHLMYFQLYDIVLGTWENYYVFGSTPDYVNLAFSVDDPLDHLINGVVQVRFYQAENGNTIHKHQFDLVVIADGYGTPSSQEIDPYSWHRNSNGETGNFSTTGVVAVGNLNVTGISYLGNLIINADNITVNNIISKSGNISFFNSTNSEIVRFLGNGNVGIGTTSPGTIGAAAGTFLDVIGTGSAAGPLATIGLGGSRTSDGTLGDITFYNTAIVAADKRVAFIRGVRSDADNSGRLDFYTYNAGSQVNGMSIKRDGNVGIGTTSPTHTLNVAGTMNVTSTIVTGLTDSYTGGSAYLCVYNNGTMFASESACP